MRDYKEVADENRLRRKPAEDCDLDVLPENLIRQCREVIESYHASHGYFCLPNLLWKSGFGPLIESDLTLRQLLRKASTARRAKKANESFVTIAATLLSLEILASNFAGWSSLFPEAGEKARTFLRQNAGGMPLMQYYVYPSKYSNVFVKLSPH